MEHERLPEIQPSDIQVDRELTRRERNLAEWLLLNGSGQSPAFLDDLRKARVYSQCRCGCASIDFVIERHPVPTGGISILGEFLFGEGDAPSGVFIFEKEGRLAGIEVYSFGDQVHTQLPDPSELRTYDSGMS
jgi:hypothetical protein